MGSQAKAIILLSGGLDSATVLAIALREGFNVHALSFRYGQRHEQELACARLDAECRGPETKAPEAIRWLRASPGRDFLVMYKGCGRQIAQVARHAEFFRNFFARPHQGC